MGRTALFGKGQWPVRAVGLLSGHTLADPTTGLTGGFGAFDEDGFFLGGGLFAIGLTEDVIKLQTNNLSGSAAGSSLQPRMNLMGPGHLALARSSPVRF